MLRVPRTPLPLHRGIIATKYILAQGLTAATLISLEYVQLEEREWALLNAWPCLGTTTLLWWCW
jgi:hypothetical protein